MVSSRYPPPPIAFDEQGNPARPVPVTSGIYASSGVLLFEETGGRLWLQFPAETSWIYGNGVVCQDMPWPGWGRVDFRTYIAVRDFARVIDAESALRYAQQNGPLWSCTRHSFQPVAPGLHVGMCQWSGAHIPDSKGSRCFWSGYEPLDWWLHMALVFRTTLEVATRLRDDEVGSAGQWRVLGIPGAEALAVSGQKGCFALVVGSWLERHPVSLSLDTELRLEMQAGLGFLPPLWHLVAAMIAGGPALALCSSCGRVYMRSGRAAKRGQRNFCPDCGERACKRISKRERSATRREQG